MNFLITSAGFVPVRGIELIEEEDTRGLHLVHYSTGAGPRQATATAYSVGELLDLYNDEK